MERYAPRNTISDPAVLEEFQRLAAILSHIMTGKFEVKHVAPAKPQDGDVAICDGTDWDPLTLGNKQPVWYNATTATWNAF